MASASPPTCLVWAVGALAEGLGIRAVARVFEVDPNTVLRGWWRSRSISRPSRSMSCTTCTSPRCNWTSSMPCCVPSRTGRSARRKPSQRLSRSPRWVWVAIDPVTKLLLALDVGDRTLAMAQRVVHQVVQVLAPGCVPLFLTDGFKEYATALLTHYGQWVQPARRQAAGPVPKPRWMPLPAAAVCAGDQDRTETAPGPRHASRGLRHPGGHRAGAGGAGAGRSIRLSLSA